MNTKTVKSVIFPICLMLLCISCNMMNSDDNVSGKESKKAIIGKWKLVEEGMYTDRITEYSSEFLMEYLPDGILNCYIKDKNDESYSDYIKIQELYSIYYDVLIEKSISITGLEKRWKYRFFENGEKLELIDADWIPQTCPPENVIQTLMYVSYIKIFKKTI